MKKKCVRLIIFSIILIGFLSGCKVTPESNNTGADNQPANFVDSSWADDVLEIDSLTESNSSVFYISENGIMRHDKDKNTNMVLVASESINSFCIYNDSLYYCESENTIYKTNMGGEGRVKIIEMSQVESLLIEKSLAHFEIYDGFVYIKSSGTSLIRFSLSTEHAENFVDDVGKYEFLNQSLFYIDHMERTFSIYGKDFCTGNTSLLRGDGITKQKSPENSEWKIELYDNVIATNGRLYYTTKAPAKLFELMPDGGDILLEDFNHLKDANYLSITVTESALYYVLESGSLKGHLFEYNAQTGEKKEVALLNDVNYLFGIKVVDGYVFYYSLPENRLTYAQM